MGKSASKVLPQAERQVATHLSAAKEAEKHVMAARREHKKDPHTQHLKSQDLVANMMSFDMISNRPEESATPAGAVNKNSRRKQAGVLQPQTAGSSLQTYGVTEAELRGMLLVCGAIRKGAEGNKAEAASLAEQFRLETSDVLLLARYNASVTPQINSALGGQSVAVRPF